MIGAVFILLPPLKILTRIIHEGSLRKGEDAYSYKACD